MNWTASALTTLSSDTQPSIIVSTEQGKYIFNTAEATGRSFLQSGSNWKKTKAVFFTDVGVHRMGGLAGLLMTWADATVSQLNVFGPTGLLHYMATMRQYTYRDSLYIAPTEVSMVPSPTALKVFSDEQVTIYGIPVWPASHPVLPSPAASGEPSSSVPQKRKQEEPTDVVALMTAQHLSPSQLSGELADDWRRRVLRAAFPAPEPAPVEASQPRGKRARAQKQQDEQQRRFDLETDQFKRRRIKPPAGFYDALPDMPSSFPRRTADPAASPVLSYVIFGPKNRGKFDSRKADALGVPNNALRGLLTKGQKVSFDVVEDGKTLSRTVEPEAVMDAPEPSSVLLILDIPSPDHIPSLLKSFEEIALYTSLWQEPNNDQVVSCVFHNCGPGVLEDERYIAFMNKFHDGCSHSVTSPEHSPDPVTFTDAAHQQLCRQALDADMFPIQKFNLTPRKDLRAIPGIPKLAELMHAGTTIKLRPASGLHVADREDRFHPALSKPLDALLKPETFTAYEQAKENVRKEAEQRELIKEEPIPGANVGIIPLGTGSAIPSKHRNVSSLLVRIPGKGNILLDAGEGTWGQLARLYGVDKTQPGNVWDVLRDIHCVFISHTHGDHHMGLPEILRRRKTLDPPPTTPLYIISVRSVHMYLREIQQVQDLGIGDASGNGVRALLSPALHYRRPESYVPSGMWQVGGTEEWLDIGLSQARAEDMKAVLGLKDFCTIDMYHRMVCYGCRIESEDGWSIAYSADTLPTDSIVRAAPESTLLIHEATMSDDQADQAKSKAHSTHSQAIVVGQKMNVKSLLLTHFSARYPKLPSSGGKTYAQYWTQKGREMTVAHAFDHQNLTLGSMWKMKHYLKGMVDTLKEEGAEEEEERALQAQ
ncbi:hypothetical protein CYLTODRAFT_349872 [Cylindrobasidium torrendii FP15055 ss-10]|uniref:ribonuclease Z n=1 Tax=Cylindrobasidium torrendii FP15055 ss-10 TaxID=1314674 RepID=A0A0D7BFG5_9AGAR|nr:hypothetical protein CYLTODRAFT_349872 [Cylindrobasidium torrendii FP15055 ss-10]